MFKKIVYDIVNKRRKISVILLASLIIIFALYLVFYSNVDALSRYGSNGDEVKQIQTKLKRWGYYTGKVDGIYGSKTVEAVKYFQRKNGLTVDGIAGTKTLAAMGIYTSSENNSTSMSSRYMNL